MMQSQSSSGTDVIINSDSDVKFNNHRDAAAADEVHRM
jgi:hypothetical protein